MGFRDGNTPNGESTDGGTHICGGYLGEDYCGAADEPITRKIEKC
jgi:hypothetical protein